MLKGVAAIGLGVLAVCAAARAQDLPKHTRLAAVDASGRILPLDAFALGAAPAAAGPCPAAKAMAPEDAKALVARIAGEEGFSPDLVQAVAKSESHYDSVALSDKGAFGLMQLLPLTADRFKVDLCDPAGNVRGGVRFLRSLLDKYKNPFFVLAAYNAGEEAVAKSRGVPPYPETVRFVAQVVNDVYGWPGPGAQARGDAGARVAAQPDVVEITPKDERPRPAATKPPGKGEWSDGFVMHVD
jgi:soluble lytic murein transglycosylase-like protein